MSVTPLGNTTHDGKILMTNDLPTHKSVITNSLGLQVAALIQFAGKEAGLAVKSVSLGLQLPNKL